MIVRVERKTLFDIEVSDETDTQVFLRLLNDGTYPLEYQLHQRLEEDEFTQLEIPN